MSNSTALLLFGPTGMHLEAMYSRYSILSSSNLIATGFFLIIQPFKVYTLLFQCVYTVIQCMTLLLKCIHFIFNQCVYTFKVYTLSYTSNISTISDLSRAKMNKTIFISSKKQQKYKWLQKQLNFRTKSLV